MKNDVSYVLILVGFFLISILFVIGCDKIIGPDEAAITEGPSETPEPGPVEEAAA
jgi:hypothetical protein